MRSQNPANDAQANPSARDSWELPEAGNPIIKFLALDCAAFVCSFPGAGIAGLALFDVACER